MSLKLRFVLQVLTLAAQIKQPNNPAKTPKDTVNLKKIEMSISA